MNRDDQSPPKLHAVSDVPFRRPAIRRTMLLAVAIVAMVVVAHRIASRDAASDAQVAARQLPTDEGAPPVHIRLD